MKLWKTKTKDLYNFVEGGDGDFTAIKINQGKFKNTIFMIQTVFFDPDGDEGEGLYNVDFRLIDPVIGIDYEKDKFDTLVGKIAMDIMEDVARDKYKGNVEYVE